MTDEGSSYFELSVGIGIIKSSRGLLDCGGSKSWEGNEQRTEVISCAVCIASELYVDIEAMLAEDK
jgi:hypothetical protein